MKKILILLLFCNIAFSQTQEGGSIYSRFGLGIMNYSTSVRSSGMSGVSIGIFDQNEMNTLNPATWSQFKNTFFSAGASYENISLEDNHSKTDFQRFNFTYSLLGIPIDKENNIVLGLGIEPVSRVGYNVQDNQIVNSLRSDLTYHGNGGISAAVLGLTWSPLSDLYLGVKLNYLFGHMRKDVTVSYSDENYFSNEHIELLIARGTGFTGGIIYSGLNKILGFPSFNIGVVFSPSNNINCRKEISSVYLVKQVSSTFDTTLIGDSKLGLPGTFGFGFSMGLNERLILGCDYIAQSWNNFNILDVKYNEIKNSSRVSLGVELLPNKESMSFFNGKVAYRLGIYYSNTNLKINSKDINEYGISAGFTIPLSRGSILNTAFTYGSRGTMDNNLILDKFIRAQFSLTIGEIWFISTEE